MGFASGRCVPESVPLFSTIPASLGTSCSEVVKACFLFNTLGDKEIEIVVMAETQGVVGQPNHSLCAQTWTDLDT